ncbi:hypothetical protein Mtai_v1c19260 [Meiothermus taiwanensis WR-220]|uniref:Lipoprotein n=1 Tax=Meiothermus taiwanensis WR-220 TaxID=1339250 RepID=A0ABN5LY61_9DEIN|nr:hypothetical protein Mtai_v1c19260 [Meiothermus taiwanensis WR-220]
MKHLWKLALGTLAAVWLLVGCGNNNSRIYKPPYPNQALQLCLEHEPPCLPIGRP